MRIRATLRLLLMKCMVGACRMITIVLWSRLQEPTNVVDVVEVGAEVEAVADFEVHAAILKELMSATTAKKRDTGPQSVAQNQLR